MQMSDELAALISRSEDAIAMAGRLRHENERWRRSVAWQLDHRLELGAEFRRLTVSRLSAIPPRPLAADT